MFLLFLSYLIAEYKLGQKIKIRCVCWLLDSLNQLHLKLSHRIKNYGILFLNHLRNFCEILRLCRTVYKTTYKKLEYNISRLPTRKKKEQFLKFLQGQKIMDVFIVCIWTNSISIISGNVFQKPFNVIMQIIFFR